MCYDAFGYVCYCCSADEKSTNLLQWLGSELIRLACSQPRPLDGFVPKAVFYVRFERIGPLQSGVKFSDLAEVLRKSYCSREDGERGTVRRVRPALLTSPAENNRRGQPTAQLEKGFISLSVSLIVAQCIGHRNSSEARTAL